MVVTSEAVVARRYCLIWARSKAPSSILNLTTIAILCIITFQTVNLTGSNRFKTLLLPLLLRLLNPHIITPTFKSLHWLKVNERIEYKFFSLTYKVLTTTQPSYLHNLISLQPPRSTRASSIVALSRPNKYTMSLRKLHTFSRATLCGVCPSVRLPRSYILQKWINISSKNFSPSGSQTILVFSVPNVMAIFRQDPLNRCVECSWGRQKSRFPTSMASSRAVNAATSRCYQHGAAGTVQVVTLNAGSKRRSLLMAGDDDEMFMTRSLNLWQEVSTLRERQQDGI